MTQPQNLTFKQLAVFIFRHSLSAYGNLPKADNSSKSTPRFATSHIKNFILNDQLSKVTHECGPEGVRL